MKLMKQKSNPSTVTIPAGTAALLQEMFTSHDGVDMTEVINDITTDGQTALTAINLGLLLNGKVLKVPETVYVLSKNRDDKVTRVQVYKKTNQSLLKDRVYYKRYQFDAKTNEDGTEEWQQDSWVSNDDCSVAAWYQKDESLPEGIQLPEIAEEDLI